MGWSAYVSQRSVCTFDDGHTSRWMPVFTRCSTRLGSSMLRAPWPIRSGRSRRSVSHTLAAPAASPACAVRRRPCSSAWRNAASCASSGYPASSPAMSSATTSDPWNRSTSMAVSRLVPVS